MFDWLLSRHGLRSAHMAKTSTASSSSGNAGTDSKRCGWLSVYIGDSSSDLMAMLAADVGIVMGANRCGAL